jgi:adenylosuccinate synthase
VTNAVLGVAFGDEGKGRVVDALCAASPTPTGVVRFSGGHQAAHRVIIGGKEHVFAHFGSGTLRGAPTYWSHYCPVAPVHLMNELEVLKSIGVNPVLHIDGKCPVTTPYDVRWNRESRKAHNVRRHGSCGVGIYATWKREKDGCQFLFEDALNPTAAKLKYHSVQDYYAMEDEHGDVDYFLKDCARIAELIEEKKFHLAYGIDDFEVAPRRDLQRQPLIFEGSQGLLLDQSYGFFPHVTPSNTGTQNVVEMLGESFSKLTTWLVTRAYATRHGNGPFVPFEEGEYEIKNPEEKNGDAGIQGKFRSGPLSLDLLRYAVNKDNYLRESGVDNLVVTCVDLLEDRRLLLVENGELVECRNYQAFYEKIQQAARAKALWTSDSSNGDIPLRRRI